MFLRSLSHIHDDPDNVRRHFDVDADAKLAESIRLTGGPIHAPVVRPHPNLGVDQYMIVAGHRRVHAARAAGLSEIFVVLTDEIDPMKLAAMRTAENTARAPLAPVDLWRALVKMQEAGWSIEDAAGAAGITLAYARRLDRLGRMDASVIEAIEKHGMPDGRHLATIANAPLAKQQEVMKLKAIYSGSGKNRTISWHDVTHRLTVTRISQDRALFNLNDHPEVVFEEDLFAEPGTDGAIPTTANVAQFLAAQRKTIETIATEKLPLGYVIKIVDQRPDYNKSIDGMRVDGNFYFGETDLPKIPKSTTLEIRVFIVDEGWAIGRVSAYILSKPERKTRASATSSSNANDADATQTEPEDREGVTIAGQKIAAQAKTDALRTATSLLTNPFELLSCLVLACAGRNVRIADDPSGFGATNVQHIAQRLLDDGELFASQDDAGERRVIAAAQSMIATMAICDVPKTSVGSGPIADVIGRAIEADRHMTTRFDTRDFLEFVTGKELLAICADLGVESPRKVDERRAALVDGAPDWRPKSAQFLAKLTPIDEANAKDADDDTDR